jgi:uncharacterized protein YecE (DUF72 family)
MPDCWIGTSGFDYKEWKPSFYPQDLRKGEFLYFYSRQLNSVEINNTFYRLPSAKSIGSWATATPEEFRFSLKAPRKITHFERLGVPSEALDYFVRVVQTLGGRLGAVLFQLPPFFKRDCERLRAFLQALPPQLPVAVEFRHDSWFEESVFAELENHGAALCINDRDDGASPLRTPGRFVYLRLRRSSYTTEMIREWQDRMRAWSSAGMEVFAYIKHEDNPEAPQIALEFARVER